MSATKSTQHRWMSKILAGWKNINIYFMIQFIWNQVQMKLLYGDLKQKVVAYDEEIEQCKRELPKMI